MNTAMMKNHEQSVMQGNEGGGGRGGEQGKGVLSVLARFAGGIAHDFNNALTVILGYTDFLLERAHPGGELHAELQEVRAAALQAADLTRLLMMFGGERVYEPVVMNVNAILSVSEGRLREMAGTQVNVELRCCKERCLVAVDPFEFEEALRCLVDNAREAMPTGGRLVIETAVCEVEGKQEVEIRVWDSGPGFSEVALEHVFEPFFTTKESVQNQGLGLFRVYAVTRQWGGRVVCRNHEKGGAEVIVTLPAAEARIREQRLERPREGAARRRITVLVVEDDARVRAVLKAALTKNGYEVVEASDGNGAWRLVQEDPTKADVMLTDVVMPGMNGYELGKRVMELRPDMKFIYMSGFSDSQGLRTDVLEQKCWFIQKPFTPQQLVQKLREVLAS